MERILVVEDNNDIRRLLVEQWLPQLGYEATSAAAFAEARAAIARQRIDLILLDLQLPDVHELEHVRELRSAYPDTPIILMPTHGLERMAVEAFRLNVRNYLPKPFTRDQLYSALEDALRERRLLHEKELLAADLQQRIHELTALHEIGRSITNERAIDQLLTQIVEAAVRLSQADEGFLLLRDAATNRLNVSAAKTLGAARAQRLRLPLHNNAAAEVLHTRKAVRINRPSESAVKLRTGYLVRSVLLVPLLVRGHAIGVLGVDNVSNRQPFDDAHERLLTALADYAAIALENARLLRASQQAEARYRDLFTHASDMFLILDAHLQIVEVNAAAPALLDYPLHDFRAKPLAELVVSEHWPAAATQLQALLAGATDNTRFEVELRKRNGTPMRVELWARVIGTGHGPHRVFCAARDLTERLQLAAQTTHAEKLAALEHVVAGVAHELNNPLTSITGYTQLLLRDNQLQGEARHDIERVLAQAQRAGHIVQGLLSFGRSTTLSRTAVNLSALLDSTLNLRTAHRWPPTISVVRELADALPTVAADPYQLQQVFLNMLNNAQRAMERAGGTLTVRTYVVQDLAAIEPQPPCTPFPANARGPAIVAEIGDTGVGIPAHQLGKIFDPFWTTKPVGDGPGLGLSASHGIIVQHGGAIWACSVEGQGTTFYVALPPRAK